MSQRATQRTKTTDNATNIHTAPRVARVVADPPAMASFKEEDIQFPTNDAKDRFGRAKAVETSYCVVKSLEIKRTSFQNVQTATTSTNDVVLSRFASSASQRTAAMRNKD